MHKERKIENKEKDSFSTTYYNEIPIKLLLQGKISVQSK